MRFPEGDLVPARRHQYGGGYGRRRRRRVRQLMVVSIVLLVIGIAFYWVNRSPAGTASLACPTGSGVLQCVTR